MYAKSSCIDAANEFAAIYKTKCVAHNALNLDQIFSEDKAALYNSI